MVGVGDGSIATAPGGGVTTFTTNGLNAAQREVLDQLGSVDRPSFDLELHTELRNELEQTLAPVTAALDEEEPLFVSKRSIGLIHSCEQLFVTDAGQPFEWNTTTARGTVAHKAIELLIGFRGSPTPLDLVDAALSRFEADGFGIGDFVRGLAEAERAELVSGANDLVTTFLETFPPLDPKWRPVPEARVRAELAGGRVQLSGKVDLQLGFSRGQEAGKVIIDLKSGRSHSSHIDDLRFYALLDTMKAGTPPRLLVSYYLESGTPRTEPVTEDVLWAAVRRTADAITRICRLRDSDTTPERSAGPACTFCPLKDECDPGIAYLAERQAAW